MASVIVSQSIKIVYEVLSNRNISSTPAVSCFEDTYWEDGREMYRALKEATAQEHEHNSGYHYDVVNFSGDRFRKVGSWSSFMEPALHMEGGELVFLGGEHRAPNSYAGYLTNYHLKVGMVNDHPYAYLRDNCTETLPECWYGLSPEIVAQLAEDLNFTYEYYPSVDRKYGGYNPKTRTWNGMIGDLLSGTTDMAPSLSVISQRSQFIDFSQPLLEERVSYIVLESKSNANTLFFIKPFHPAVWATIILIIIVLAVFVCILSKLSPAGKFL